MSPKHFFHLRNVGGESAGLGSVALIEGVEKCIWKLAFRV